MRARQHADLAVDRPHGFDVASVDPGSAVENIPADDFSFEILKNARGSRRRIFRLRDIGRAEVTHHTLFGGVDGLVALHLLGDGIGGAQILFDQLKHLLFECGVVRHHELARLFRRLLGELDDGIDHRLKMTVAKHHRAEHDVLGQFLGFQFDHQHGVLRAGDHEIKLAFAHLVDLRIEYIFVIDEADARSADRSHKRGT